MSANVVICGRTAPLKVWIVCTGVGRVSRGVETFAQNVFLALRDTPGLVMRLLKGGGDTGPGECVLPSLSRDHPFTLWLGRLFRRDGYVVEQWSSFFPLVWMIWRGRPDLIFYGDANLGFLLYRLRSLLPIFSYRLLYHNGGPCDPPFVRTDTVQQLSPLYRDQALAAGEPAAKHFLIPIGVETGAGPLVTTPQEKLAIRNRLGIPPDKPVIISVGWIRSVHKRMDYLINEVAALPEPRPFLVMLGQQDALSREIATLAAERLGATNHLIRTVRPSEVGLYYQSADIFVLASLLEAFGIVYLESLMHGLPTIAHRHPVMEYVLGDAGTLADLSCPGNLTAILEEQLAVLADANPGSAMRRWESVRSRFSWEVLRPGYLRMFFSAAGRETFLPSRHEQPQNQDYNCCT